MISLKLRIIREQNRLYSFVLGIISIVQPQCSKIFLFHDIVDNISDVKSRFAITQISFEEFLIHQLSEGYHPNTFDELEKIISGKVNKQDHSFIVTFDDVNENVYTKAYPFLKEHNIPFIIFVTENLIGKPNFLNKEQLLALSADPLCTVGSHGCHHVMFRYLSSLEAEKELKESRLFLEKLTGKDVNCFAFPYGRLVECSRENIKTLKKSVYYFAFSAIKGNLSHKWLSSKYYLPRINVDESMIRRLKEARKR